MTYKQHSPSRATFFFTIAFALTLWLTLLTPRCCMAVAAQAVSDAQESKTAAADCPDPAAEQGCVIINEQGESNEPSSSSITFIATSNKNLEPVPIYTPPDYGRTEDIDMLLRTTAAFKSHYPSLKARSEEAEARWEKAKPRVLIRGTSLNNATIPLDEVELSILGLAGTVLAAYNYHQNLELRPDDIWIEILAQFSAYVNGRAEALRSKFVTHQGQKELKVVEFGDIYTADFGKMTRQMLNVISNNIKDPSLREWILPGFSTSTDADNICAAAMSMCTMQKYFKYKYMLLCGIPQVTLWGTVDDWVLLRRKVDRLLEFEDTTENGTKDSPLSIWVTLLQEICDNFVESAKTGSKNNLEFWDTIVSNFGGGSGSVELSGWITVFSYFDNDGNLTPTIKHPADSDFNLKWPAIDSDDLNENVVSTPVLIDDNGVEYDARLFVGHMALDAVIDEAANLHPPEPVKKELSKRQKIMAVKPRSDWALVIDKEGRTKSNESVQE